MDVAAARPELHPEDMKGTARLMRDRSWLRLHRQGWSAGELTARSGCSLRYVQRRLAAAERAERKAAKAREVARRSALPPELEVYLSGIVPLFPMGGTPFKSSKDQECPHRGPIRAGSAFCCMVCHATGYEAEIAARLNRRAAAAA